MLAQDNPTNLTASNPPSNTSSFHPQPLLRFVEYDFVPWEEDEPTEPTVGSFPGTSAAQPGISPYPKAIPTTPTNPEPQFAQVSATVNDPESQSPGGNSAGNPLPVQIGRVEYESKDRSSRRYSSNGSLKVAPAIRKRQSGERTLDKDYKLLKELSDNLGAVPGLEKVRWQSILQNTRGPEVGERETQRRVKEAELLGTRLFGGDIRKLLTSVLNAHLDFLVKYVGSTLSTSKRGHKKVRDQLWKVLLECKLKAEKDAAEGKIEEEREEEDKGIEDDLDEEEETGMQPAVNINAGIHVMNMNAMNAVTINGINMNGMSVSNARVPLNLETQFKQEST